MDLKVLDNINHNGKSYVKGEVMYKVSKKDAERLINLGAAEEVIKTEEEIKEENKKNE